MKFGLSEDQLRQIRDVLARHPEITEAVIFGSRAMGNYKEASDVDIAIKGDVNASTAAKLKVDLEDGTALPFFFDLVAYTSIDNPKLTEHIDKYGITLYFAGWKDCKLGDLITLEYGKSLKNYEGSGDYPVYGTNGKIGSTDSFLSPIPSVILGRKGAYRGVHFSKQPFFVIDTAFYAKPKTEEIDMLYLYNYLLTQDINAMDSGSAIPSTDKYEIYDLDIRLPSLPKQRAIAGVLSSLDEKINLLHRQNKTLEGMAAALWRKMFVEEADVKWKISKLEEIISIKHGFAFSGSYIVSEETENILVTPGNFKIGGGFKTDKFKYYSGADVPNEFILSENDLIITMTDLSKEGDTLGYPAFVPDIAGKKFLHNQRIGKVEFNPSPCAQNLKYYLYFTFMTEDYRAYILGTASGTSILHTSPTRICDYEIQIPDNVAFRKFGGFAKPIFQRIKAGQNQIQKLSSLRDALLLKLISGEVTVKT